MADCISYVVLGSRDVRALNEDVKNVLVPQEYLVSFYTAQLITLNYCKQSTFLKKHRQHEVLYLCNIQKLREVVSFELTKLTNFYWL